MEQQAERPMDPVQMTRLLLWLDEEHRKDKSELQLLKERLANQAPINENQAAQLRDLSAQLAALKNHGVKIAQLEDGLNQARAHLSQHKEQQDHAREESSRTEAARKSELEHLLKSRASLEQRLEQIARDAAAPMPRVQALSEEFKRVMTVFPQFESVRQQMNTLAAKLPGLENEDRRSNDRLAAIERAQEDLRNINARIQEEHRLANEEQRHAVEDFTAQAKALGRRFEERTASLQNVTQDRAQDRELVVAVQAQIDGLKKAQSGMESRIGRLEELVGQHESQSLRMLDGLTQSQQDLTRLVHVHDALEQRMVEEMPSVRKGLTELDTQSRAMQGEVADLALQYQRDRESLIDVRRQIATLTDRLDRGLALLIEFQEQTLREQVNALSQRIQDSQRLPRPGPGHD